MAVPKPIRDSVGSWRGTSRLHLPFLPEDRRITSSPSKLHIDLDEQASYATVAYTWEHEGKRHEGVALIAAGEKEASAGWCDSWHQNASVMHLAGPVAEPLWFTGSWGEPGQPPWGWKLGFEASGEKLVLRMAVVTPDGDEEWAVEGIYERA